LRETTPMGDKIGAAFLAAETWNLKLGTTEQPKTEPSTILGKAISHMWGKMHKVSK